MPTSEGRNAVFILVLSVNVAVTLAFFVLRDRPLGYAGDDLYEIEDRRIAVSPRSILCTPETTKILFDRLIREKKVLFLGTSESTIRESLCEQLNALGPAHPGMAKVARGGLSAIHRTVALTAADQSASEFPPMLIITNLVYFTRSHDYINDSWLGSVVPSSRFLQLNHRRLREGLTDEVNSAYAAHFSHNRLIEPIWLQEYAGNLMYLYCHRAEPELPDMPLETPTYRFDGTIPPYDRARNIHEGHESIDRFDTKRWEVVLPGESVNLKGLRNSWAILKRRSAPVLRIILPMNRKYYAAHGMDMEEFDRRFALIRDEVRAMCDKPPFHVIDLYDEPPLDFGFADRMHQDPYGNYQLARYILQTRTYAEFLDDVAKFYAARPK